MSNVVKMEGTLTFYKLNTDQSCSHSSGGHEGWDDISRDSFGGVG